MYRPAITLTPPHPNLSTAVAICEVPSWDNCAVDDQVEQQPLPLCSAWQLHSQKPRDPIPWLSFWPCPRLEATKMQRSRAIDDCLCNREDSRCGGHNQELTGALNFCPGFLLSRRGSWSFYKDILSLLFSPLPLLQIFIVVQSCELIGCWARSPSR